jgi:subtilisin family serine protease
VDLYAPGVNITSAWNTSDNTINTISGTSMASPHVSGAAALYLESNQNAAPAAVSAAITSNGTSNVLRNVFFGTPNTLLYTEFAAVSGCGGDLRTGTTKAPGQVTYEFSAEGFAGNGGTYSGAVSSPAGTQFSLVLERKKL